MKPIVLIAFLALNFLALGIGSFVANPAEDAIYQNLNRAPWTPPGWVFGVAWTVIMICYAFFMEGLYRNAMENSKLVLVVYAIQWLLNVSWNPIFFDAHLYLPGLLVLLALFAVLLFQAKIALPYSYGSILLIAPYLLWMTIAISLNTYVVLYN